jgi:site-specific recombinase XerD
MTTAVTTIERTEPVTVMPAGKNPAIVYLARLKSEASRRTMRQALNAIADIAHPGADLYVMPWAALRYEHTSAIRARLSELHNYQTANKMLSALRQTLKEAWRLGQMSAEEYMRAADLENVKGEKPPQAAGRAVTLGELMALATSCQDGTAAGARDAAILAVAYACGLRRAEIVGLDLVHYVDGVLTVLGKRNKVRTVPIENGARAALDAWLAVRGNEAGALFLHIGKDGCIVKKWVRYDDQGRRWILAQAGDAGAKLQGMTTQAVYLIMERRAKAAGVKAFSPHDMRRTFAGDLLDAGADISTVQKLMGHANVTTTAGYDRRGERAKRDAAKRLHFPYQAK